MPDAVTDDAIRVATLALDEDGMRDISSLVAVAVDQQGTASIEAREDMLVAGVPYADAVVAACHLEPVRWFVPTNGEMNAGTVIGEVSGDLINILRAERPLLNLLQRAAGIATITSKYVAAVAGTRCQILHTRKTTPGLRLFELAAVVAGGGQRHRADLVNDVMIKDNHWQAMRQQGSSLLRAFAEARMLGATSLQVEVETLEQLDEACAAGASRLLIDNQTPATVAKWLAHARSARPDIEVEATGGITLENVRQFAETGVDFISVGALTHSVRSVDIGMEVTGK